MDTPPPRNFETIQTKDGKISYVKTEANARLIAKLIKSMGKKHSEREAREAAEADRPPPDLTPNQHLVAFIDILGFGHEIGRATTRADLERIHHKVATVQREFLKVEAAKNPAEQRGLNATFGRRVIALSDAVLVVISPNAPARSLLGPYDHLGLVLGDLVLAQGRCVANHGIFVRGGVSLGSFFFEDDILISPALAQAYELESKHAEHPVIVVPDSLRQEILNAPGKEFYAKDADPTPQYFRRHGQRKWKGEALYYLDYLSPMAGGEAGWEEVAACFRVHRERIESAYAASPVEKVRKKYRWLMRYHNRCLLKDVEYVKDEGIDLSRYPAP